MVVTKWQGKSETNFIPLKTSDYNPRSVVISDQAMDILMAKLRL